LEPDVAIFNVNAMQQLISNSPAAFMRSFTAFSPNIFVRSLRPRSFSSRVSMCASVDA